MSAMATCMATETPSAYGGCASAQLQLQRFFCGDLSNATYAAHGGTIMCWASEVLQKVLATAASEALHCRTTIRQPTHACRRHERRLLKRQKRRRAELLRGPCMKHAVLGRDTACAAREL